MGKQDEINKQITIILEEIVSQRFNRANLEKLKKMIGWSRLDLGGKLKV